jgi:hypothetical protein
MLISWLILLGTATTAAAWLGWNAVREWRRAELASEMLEILEIGHRQGWTPEATLVSACGSRDTRLPVRLHLLGALLEEGMPLGTAMDAVPEFLPAAVRSQLKLGLETGEFPAMLQIATASLGKRDHRRRLAPLTGLLLYGIVPLFGSAFFLFLGLVFRSRLWFWLELLPPPLPSGDLGSSTTPQPVPGGGTMNTSIWLAGILFCLALMLHLWMFSRSVGPWLTRKLPVLDHLWLLVPWRRLRFQRDFAATLGAMLDAGMKESRAVVEAGKATGNSVILNRARRSADRLANGERLDEVLSALFHSGELKWRLEAGMRGVEGFRTSLSGWLESLEESAIRKEVLFAQAFTTALLLLNGLAVGAAAVGMFRFFVAVLDGIQP